MGMPTRQELALQAEVRQLRERIANLEQGRQPETSFAAVIGNAKALRQSEARWIAAIENLESGVVIATETENVIYRNPAARIMHGFAGDQTGLGSLQDMRKIFELWTPDGQLVSLDDWPMLRLKRGESFSHLELRLCRLDQGWEKIISYSGAIVESAIGERLMFVSAQDLTEQRKAEQSLRESEERLRLLGDNLPDSAVYQFVDEPGVSERFTYLSAGIERLNDFTVEGVLRDKSTLHKRILPEYWAGFVEANRTASAVSPTSILKSPCGGPMERFAGSTSTPARGGSLTGGPSGTVS